MSEDNKKDSNQLHELMGALDATTSLIQTLLLDLKANSSALGSLEAQVDNIQKDLDEIDALVRGGDQPLLTKFALVAKSVGDLEKQMSSLVAKLEKEEDKHDNENLTIMKSRTHLTGLIVTGLLGIIASMITYFLTQGN